MSNQTPQEIWSQGDYHKIAAEHMIVSEKLCAQVGITARQRVLDVACGTGNTAIAAARRRASVTGIDLVPALIDRARQRAVSEGMESINFRVGDARKLDFPDASFDVVLSTFGAVFVLDQPQAARELMRVTKPGGIIALTAYTRHSIPSEVYRLSASMVPPPKTEIPAYAWADGKHAAALLSSGCTDIRVMHDGVDCCFASAEAFFENNSRYYGPVITRLSKFSDEQRIRFHAGLIAILDEHNRATDGSLVAVFDYATIIATRSVTSTRQEKA